MKSYLSSEDSREAVESHGFPEKITDRKTMYFVLKGDDWKSVEGHAKKLGAKMVRVLTDKEIASEAEDGSYDIEL
jgi:hypothetical protein